MNKKNKILIIFLIILILGVLFERINTNKSNVYEEQNVSSIKKDKELLSMNLEQTAGAGDYKTVTQSKWPTEGYKFNSELSRCENGSELSWDDTKKAVIVSGNLTDKCYVYFDKVLTLAEYVISQYTGTQGDNSLYYHNSTLTNGAGDNSYRYAGGDYVLTDAGKATGATMMIGYNNSVTTALIDFYCNGTKSFVGDECDSAKDHYYLIRNDATRYRTYNEALSMSEEKGYLTKDNVKNFVCFGSDITPCPTENLYRIIGVFDDKVKLIKWDYTNVNLLGKDGEFKEIYSASFRSGIRGEKTDSHTTYNWRNSESSGWCDSLLNTTNLNTNFINNIGAIWAKRIATTTWNVGGGSYVNIYSSVPKTAYQFEVGEGALSTTCDAKIGLMYVSDYYYAASPSAWILLGWNNDYAKSYALVKSDNWMYGGGYDWTITRVLDNDNQTFRIGQHGLVYYSTYNLNYNGVRPAFYLNPSVKYISGTGISTDPIILGD